MSGTDSESSIVKNEVQQILKVARETKDYDAFLARIPYAELIGTKIMPMGNELVYLLPGLDSNIGNLMLPAIHGGCIGGFMENSAALEIMLTLDVEHLPKIVDFSIDYLRTGKKQNTFAQCQVVRQGRKIVNVSVTAWQTTRDEPIATARAHFLLDD